VGSAAGQAPAAARPDDRLRGAPACGLARPREIRDAPAGAGEGGGARLLEALPSRLPHGLLVAAGRFHLMPRRHFSTKCKGPTSRVGPLRRLAKTRALLGLALLLGLLLPTALGALLLALLGLAFTL